MANKSKASGQQVREQMNRQRHILNRVAAASARLEKVANALSNSDGQARHILAMLANSVQTTNNNSDRR